MKKEQNMRKSTKRCTRCIIDTSVPGVVFDENGICNFCHLHDKMEKEYPQGQDGKKIIDRFRKEMQEHGQGKKYDCAVGISGGRDSCYSLFYIKKILKLRPLAVHFNDGFGNPTAGENIIKICKKLNVDLRTITSDWRESKDLKIAFLKASVLDIEEGTDVGIATALYGTAAKEDIKHIIIGQSFRTEGIAPLSWNYLDGKYLKSVHDKFGKFPLRRWKPTDPGFNLGLKEMFYYTIIKGIKTIPVLYYLDYNREKIDKLLVSEFDWKKPGAHYADDLYQSLMTYVYRVKFKVDRRIYNYSALVRSKQMSRTVALQKVKRKYSIENQKIIDLCLKRLGLTKQEFEIYLKQPPKSFHDYPNNYELIKRFKMLIKILCRFHFLPSSIYDKYFNCGI